MNEVAIARVLSGWKPRCVCGLLVLLFLLCHGAVCVGQSAPRAEGSLNISIGKETIDTTPWNVLLRDILASMAVVVGGIWTIWLVRRRRQHYPCANVKVVVEHHACGEDQWLVRVGLVLSNAGRVIFDVDSAEVWLTRVEPFEEEATRSLTEMPIKVVPSERDLLPSAEAKWPYVANREIVYYPEQLMLEPKEAETIPFEFLIPSTNTRIAISGRVVPRPSRFAVLSKPAPPSWRFGVYYALEGKDDVISDRDLRKGKGEEAQASPAEA